MFEYSRSPALIDLAPNAWSEAWEERLGCGDQVWDLGVSNPTSVGLPRVELSGSELCEAFGGMYAPISEGMDVARQSIARYYGGKIPAERICVFSSTSEAFCAIFKLLCAPGDEIISFYPGYPLLDCLCQLEAIQLRKVALQDSAGLWEVDFFSLDEAIGPRCRGIVVVNPNNPTGHCMSRAEQSRLIDLCATRGIALIVDEVFSDYIYSPAQDLAGGGAAAMAKRGLVFSLSGLSKVCGTPQHKLAWCGVGGSPELCDEAVQRLHYIADATLSTSTWVQSAAPLLLARREAFIVPCMQRLAKNLAYLQSQCDGSCMGLEPVQAGWFAPIRVYGVDDDEWCAVDLAKRGVRVFAGSFFSYHSYRAVLVLSLLCQPESFVCGIEELRAYLKQRR